MEDSKLVWDEEKGEFVDPDAQEEGADRPDWVPDAEVLACKTCLKEFSFFVRRHHCRGCGQIFCNECTNYRIELPKGYDYVGKQRVCLHCYTWVSDQIKGGGLKGAVAEEIRTARYYIRDAPDYVFQEEYDIGRRDSSTKCFALVDHVVGVNTNKEVIIVADPCKSALELPGDTGVRFFRYILKTLDHPYIQPVVKADILIERNKALVFRQHRKFGSLKDLVFKTNCKNTWVKKYGPGRTGKALGLEAVALYGRQILEALSYLHRLGYSFPHLHSGNVLVSDDKRWCMLTELENPLLGLQPYYFLESKYASPEVECFGNLLYEISMGQERPTSEPNDFVGSAPPVPDNAPKGVKEVLRCIFEPTSEAPPSIEELLSFQLFASVPLAQDSSRVPKLKSKAQQLLESVKEQQMNLVAERLKEVETRREVAMEQKRAEEEALQRKAREGAIPTSGGPKRKKPVSSAGGSKIKSTTAPARAKSPPPTQAAATTSAPPLPPRDDSDEERAEEEPQPVANKRKSATSASAPIKKVVASNSAESVPAPPPAPAPPVKSVVASLPPSDSSRNDLLASIRNPNNMKSLKKADSRKLAEAAPPSANSSKGTAVPTLSIQDALKAKFASLSPRDEEWEDE